MTSLLHYAALVGGYGLVASVLIGVFFIAIAERTPVTEDGDQFAPESPAIPPAIVVHLSVSDRLVKRDTASPEEMAALRAAVYKLRDREIVAQAIRDAGGC